MRTSWEEAQQSKYESKRSSLPLNSFFTAPSTLAGCVTTKPLIDVAKPRSITKADWCIVVVAIKAPESVTDEHAVLLAAIKCHVMALEKRGQELRKPDGWLFWKQR
jgi:hypothetical protein